YDLGPVLDEFQGERDESGEDQVNDRHRAPDFDRAEVRRNDLLALAGQFGHTDHDEERRILETDDALVAHGRDHAPQRDRADDIGQDLPERQAHGLTGFLQALGNRLQRTAHDLGDIGAGVDHEREDRRHD